MIENICLWLKTTIPGLIILGALGSILAVWLLKLASILSNALLQLLTKYLPTQAKLLVDWYNEKLRKVFYDYGYRFGMMAGKTGTWGSIVYFSYHLFCSLLFLNMTGFFLLATISAIAPLSGTRVLTAVTFSLVVASMISAIWSIKHALFVVLPYWRYESLEAIRSGK